MSDPGLVYGACPHGQPVYPHACDACMLGTRTGFTTTPLDGGGLPDTWKLFTLADQWRDALDADPYTVMSDSLIAAILEQGYDPDVVGASWIAAWRLRTVARRRGWRAWYHHQVVRGQTRDEWAALPDGILAVVVDLPDLDFLTIRARSINAGIGRTLLQSRDPFWWDDDMGHPRDETVIPFPGADPALVKQGTYISNPGMAAIRLTACASLNWEEPPAPWTAWLPLRLP